MSKAERYCAWWEEIDELKEWLMPYDGNFYTAYCRFCERQLTAKLAHLKRHARTLIHRKAKLFGRRLTRKEILKLRECNSISSTTNSAIFDEPQVMKRKHRRTSAHTQRYVSEDSMWRPDHTDIEDVKSLDASSSIHCIMCLQNLHEHSADGARVSAVNIKYLYSSLSQNTSLEGRLSSIIGRNITKLYVNRGTMLCCHCYILLNELDDLDLKVSSLEEKLRSRFVTSSHRSGVVQHEQNSRPEFSVLADRNQGNDHIAVSNHITACDVTDSPLRDSDTEEVDEGRMGAGGDTMYRVCVMERLKSGGVLETETNAHIYLSDEIVDEESIELKNLAISKDQLISHNYPEVVQDEVIFTSDLDMPILQEVTMNNRSQTKEVCLDHLNDLDTSDFLFEDNHGSLSRATQDNSQSHHDYNSASLPAIYQQQLSESEKITGDVTRVQDYRLQGIPSAGELFRQNKLRCDICGLLAASRAQLTEHWSQTHPDKLLVCPVCDKKFIQNSSLSKHVLTHKEPEFFCDVCNQGFQNRRDLERHKIFRHSMLRMFACLDCCAKFKTKWMLQRHIRTVHRHLLMAVRPSSMAAV